MSPGDNHITSSKLKSLPTPEQRLESGIEQPINAAQGAPTNQEVRTHNGRIRPRRGADSSSAYLEEMAPYKKEQLLTSMIQLVDGLFDILQMSAYEINKGTQGTELELTWSRPSIEKSDVRNWLASPADGMAFTGRMSSRYWTLILKGTVPEVFVYVIPTEKLLSLNTNPELFQPYMRLGSVISNNEVAWCVDNFQITGEHLPAIARHLMETLIKYAQNKGSGSTLFSLAAAGIETPTKPSENDESEIEKRYRQKLLAQLADINGSDVFQTEEKSNYAPNSSASNSALYTDTNNSSFEFATDDSFTMPQVLTQLLKALNAELETISKAGAIAFENQDMARAQAIIAFTNRLNEFKKLATELYRDYQDES